MISDWCEDGYVRGRYDLCCLYKQQHKVLNSFLVKCYFHSLMNLVSYILFHLSTCVFIC